MEITGRRAMAMIFVVGLFLGVWKPLKTDAEGGAGQHADEAPRFEVDPYWPKPLPDRWVTGEFGGVCVDAHDHVFVVTRGNLEPEQLPSATVAPPIIEFDADGNVVNSWGDRDFMPKRPHGCFIDQQGNFWVGGADAVIQEYAHDGSKMLFQIGIKGKFDSIDGKENGSPLNSSHELLNSPAGAVVDSTNGDIYVADGYGNHRVVVFDREGHYLRQWGRHGTPAEAEAGVGGTFVRQVHFLAIGNDGVVYVCDTYGHRIELFDKAGSFLKNYSLLQNKSNPAKGGGNPCAFGFSPDPAQRFMYVGDCANMSIRVFDRATGQELSSFGRPGNQAGEFGGPHALAVDSKGNIIEADNHTGRKIQMFRLVR